MKVAKFTCPPRDIRSLVGQKGHITVRKLTPWAGVSFASFVLLLPGIAQAADNTSSGGFRPLDYGLIAGLVIVVVVLLLNLRYVRNLPTKSKFDKLKKDTAEGFSEKQQAALDERQISDAQITQLGQVFATWGWTKNVLDKQEDGSYKAGKLLAPLLEGLLTQSALEDYFNGLNIREMFDEVLEGYVTVERFQDSLKAPRTGDTDRPGGSIPPPSSSPVGHPPQFDQAGKIDEVKALITTLLERLDARIEASRGHEEKLNFLTAREKQNTEAIRVIYAIFPELVGLLQLISRAPLEEAIDETERDIEKHKAGLQPLMRVKDEAERALRALEDNPVPEKLNDEYLDGATADKPTQLERAQHRVMLIEAQPAKRARYEEELEGARQRLADAKKALTNFLKGSGVGQKEALLVQLRKTRTLIELMEEARRDHESRRFTLPDADDNDDDVASSLREVMSIAPPVSQPPESDDIDLRSPKTPSGLFGQADSDDDASS